MPMRKLWMLAATLACCTVAAARQAGGGLFDVGKEKAVRAVVTIGEEWKDFESGEPPMALALRGVLADLKTSKLDQLRACLPANPMLGDAGGAERLCTVHLIPKGGAPVRKVAIVRSKSGGYIALESEGEHPRRAELKKDAVAALLAEWPAYRGSFEPSTEPLGRVFELEPPYVAGRFIVDKKTIAERFNGGASSSLEGADRDLSKEKFNIRLPQGYSPRSPAGLLVWVNAMNSGAPPEVFWPALDELNIICIGANDSGNNRHVSNREQLALDAVATAARRYHIDSRRVYITGISGGGRVSSMMTACFPDVFTGAVPIVGLACYENVPNGTGRFYRAGFAKPRADLFALFKTRRVAPITGRKDFNQVEIEQAAAIMKLDGVSIRVFQEVKLGHELPPPALFADAIRWVDEPAIDMRKARADGAEKSMAAYTAKYGEVAPRDDAGRKMLLKVMETGPWTEASWKAGKLLNLAP